MKTNRPKTLWIALVFLILVAAVTVPSAIYWAVSSLQFAKEGHVWGFLTAYIPGLVWRAVAAVIVVAAVRGILKRSPSGKWLTVIAIVISYLIIFIARITSHGNAVNYANSAQEGTAALLDVIGTVCIALLAARVAFAKNSKQYFSNGAADV